MSDMILPTMEVVQGEPYTARQKGKTHWYEFETRTDYVRFRWGTGFLIIQKSEFDNNKKMQKLILDTILGRVKQSKKRKK